MNSEQIKVKYIECNRGAHHQGELLNIVCLNAQCKSNALCCCVCADQFHKGHMTTTLKKILIDSKEAGKSSEKQKVKPTLKLNNDIISNLVESSKKDTLLELKLAFNKIRQSLEKIESGLNEYYEQIEQVTNNQEQSNPAMKIFQSIENIQGSSTLGTIQFALKQLLQSMEEIKKDKYSKLHRTQPTQDSIINLIAHSNKEIADLTINGLKEIQTQLETNYNSISKSIGGVKNLFNKEVFYFSTQLKSNDIQITDSCKVVSKKGQQYQVVLMQPEINFIEDATCFRFKINKSVSNWIALGMCHKNILQKKNFAFDCKSIGHGCYMISSNAGTLSHITQELNNKVKAFNFKQGDIINCIVDKNLREIFFTKEIQTGMLTKTQRQIYELPYIDDPSDQLHPCVVFYFENDEVQYLPSINLSSVPRFDYLFSNVEKHPRIKVTDSKKIRAIEGNNQYRAVLLDKCLEENLQTPKKFSFKILKSRGDWIALGICHSKIAKSFDYGFNYQSTSHGYYMISANGGTWSSIDSTKNNLVKAFKFVEGDIIQCEVKFGQSPTDPNNKIIFRKGIESYELNFKQIPEDKLYPCAMLHYLNDEISILPSF